MKNVFRETIAILSIGILSGCYVAPRSPPVVVAPSYYPATVAVVEAPPPVAIAPPPIPVYIVPSPPAPGFIWTPGYWHWGAVGYYWVPGVWVEPPAVGVLWTPGYWGWGGGSFAWHAGYWGPHVGFYGGINYGGGYSGGGFSGGGWQNGTYVVNRSVTNVSNITNVTNNNYITNNTPVGTETSAANTSTPSFNGGPGGTTATPTPQQQAAAEETHLPPTSAQVNHVQAAANNPQLRASENNGKPAIAATTKPGVFSGSGVVSASAVGAPNPAAEAHNQAILRDPSLAKGAALPASFAAKSAPSTVTDPNSQPKTAKAKPKSHLGAANPKPVNKPDKKPKKESDEHT